MQFEPIFIALTGLSMAVFFPTLMNSLTETFEGKESQVVPLALSGIDFFLIIFHLGFGQYIRSFGISSASEFNFALGIGVIFLLIYVFEWKADPKEVRV
jgi:ABC-type multidrug transport system permease subunit